MSKTFELKKLVNNKGFYCKIEFELVIFSDKKMELILAGDNKRWANAAYFGASYFFEKFSILREQGFKLIIQEIDGQVVDTTNTVVLYSVISLLSEETKYQIDGFTIDINGNIVLPK